MSGGKSICKAWTFMSSNGYTLYQALLYMNGTTSCDCPGWTRRIQRSCKHTRSIEMGTADAQCKSSVSYVGDVVVKPRHAFESALSVSVVAGKPVQIAQPPAFRGRKIRFEDDDEPKSHEKKNPKKAGKTGRS